MSETHAARAIRLINQLTHTKGPSATIYVLADSRRPDCVRYVGQTRIDMSQRLRRHWVTALAGAREHRAVWMRAVQAAGADVVIAAVDYVPYDQADAAEQMHVARFRELGCDLTNRTDGGRGKRGWEVSDATRRKMSESAKQRPPRSLEYQRKMSEGIRNSAAHRQHLVRLHAGNRGVTRTPEQRERISRSLRGDRNGQNVLTWDAVDAIRRRFAAGGVRQAHLAREFHVSNATIHRVVHGLGWVP